MKRPINGENMEKSGAKMEGEGTMKKLLLVVVIAEALLFCAPRIASADPAIYRTVAMETKNTEVSIWHNGGAPSNIDIIIRHAKAGRKYTIKAKYWTGRRWSKVKTKTIKARRNGEMLFFDFQLRGIRNRSGAVIKLKINGRLVGIRKCELRYRKRLEAGEVSAGP